MPQYEYLINRRVLEAIGDADEEERARLLAAMNRLTEHREQVCDFHERDETGVEIRCKWFGNWLVRYWVDSPMRRVVIVDCQWT